MERKSLSGPWLFATDAADVGICERWAEAPLQNARTVNVPHIWQTLGGDMIGYSGAAWYERTFTPPAHRSGERVLLCFGAVDYYADVWLNGSFAAHHEGGFTPFEADVTHLLTPGENRLTVRAYDMSDNSEIPIGKQGSWYTRASGIWQEVSIELRPELSVEELHITPDVGARCAHVRLVLNAKPHAAFQAACNLCEHPSGAPALPAFERTLEARECCFTLPLPDCTLWEPENPFLYEFSVSWGGYTHSAVFGMREVGFADGQILLNGRPLTVRGALDQAFYPDTGYFASGEQAIREEIALVKRMGFNLLRKHIKVELPLYLYWADRLGLLIWAEPPNYVKWTRAATCRFESEYFAMIRRDYNHPSIIIWSAYNEEWGLEWNLREDETKQRHVQELYERVKRLDATRLLCDNSGWAHVKTDVNDHHRYYVCPDQLARWRQDLDDFVLGAPGQNFVKGAVSRGEPVLVSEFGTWGLPDEQAIHSYYGGWPWWFANNSVATHQDDYKKPTTLRENFARYKLDAIFGTTAELSKASQRRMARSNKALIEEMRKRPALAGYVITELSDIEWEANGIVDFFRGPKEGFEEIPDYNGPLCVMLEDFPPNLCPGDEWETRVLLANDDARRLSGNLTWELEGTACRGSLPLPDETARFFAVQEPVRLTVPADCAGFYRLTLRLTLEDGTCAKNSYELTVVPQPRLDVCVADAALPPHFREKLAACGMTFSPDAEILLTTGLTENVLRAAENGKRVLFFAEDGDSLDDKWMFTFRELDRGESWPRASSMNYINSARVCPLLRPELGFEAARLLPAYVVPFSDYKKVTNGRTINMFGNRGIEKSCTILSGYFQGWLGQFGAVTLQKPHGRGSILLTTLRLMESMGQDPIAASVLDGLLQLLKT